MVFRTRWFIGHPNREPRNLSVVRGALSLLGRPRVLAGTTGNSRSFYACLFARAPSVARLVDQMHSCFL